LYTLKVTIFKWASEEGDVNFSEGATAAHWLAVESKTKAGEGPMVVGVRVVISTEESLA